MGGPACRVRRATFDDPSRFSGHDRRAAPNLFAHTSIARRDRLVGSAAQRWVIHSNSTGTTNVLPYTACQLIYKSGAQTLSAVCYTRRAPKKLFA